MGENYVLVGINSSSPRTRSHGQPPWVDIAFSGKTSPSPGDYWICSPNFPGVILIASKRVSAFDHGS